MSFWWSIVCSDTIYKRKHNWWPKADATEMKKDTVGSIWLPFGSLLVPCLFFCDPFWFLSRIPFDFFRVFGLSLGSVFVHIWFHSAICCLAFDFCFHFARRRWRRRRSGDVRRRPISNAGISLLNWTMFTTSFFWRYSRQKANNSYTPTLHEIFDVDFGLGLYFVVQPKT